MTALQKDQTRKGPPEAPAGESADVGCFSTAEYFIVALVDAGRATTVGRTTGGGSGNPLPFTLIGGAQVRFYPGAE